MAISTLALKSLSLLYKILTVGISIELVAMYLTKLYGTPRLGLTMLCWHNGFQNTVDQSMVLIALFNLSTDIIIFETNKRLRYSEEIERLATPTGDCRTAAGAAIVAGKSV